MALDEKLNAIDGLFRPGSKRNQVARYIVRKNREIPKDERAAIEREIPIAESTLEGVFTKLRKVGLYPPDFSIQFQSRVRTQSERMEKPRRNDAHITRRRKRGPSVVIKVTVSNGQTMINLPKKSAVRLGLMTEEGEPGSVTHILVINKIRSVRLIGVDVPEAISMEELASA